MNCVKDGTFLIYLTFMKELFPVCLAMIHVNEMLKKRIEMKEKVKCKHTDVLNNKVFKMRKEGDSKSSLHRLLGTGSVHVGQHVASSAVLAICPSTLE